MGCRALAVCDGKGGGSASWVGNVVDVVRAVEVLAVPAAVYMDLVSILDRRINIFVGEKCNLQREDNTGSNTTRAGCGGERLGIKLGIEARRVRVALEVGTGKASVAALGGLHSQAACLASVGVAREHSEALWDGE